MQNSPEAKLPGRERWKEGGLHGKMKLFRAAGPHLVLTGRVAVQVGSMQTERGVPVEGTPTWL